MPDANVATVNSNGFSYVLNSAVRRILEFLKFLGALAGIIVLGTFIAVLEGIRRTGAALAWILYNAPHYISRVTDPILRIFQPLDTRLTPRLMAVLSFAYNRVIKPILTMHDLYAKYINVPLAKAIESFSMWLKTNADSLQNRWARRLGLLAAFAVGLGLQAALALITGLVFTIYNVAFLATLMYFALPPAAIVTIWFLPYIATQLAVIGTILGNLFVFMDKFFNRPENPRAILMQLNPVLVYLEFAIEPSVWHDIGLITSLAEIILPWRRQAAAERAVRAAELEAQIAQQAAQNAPQHAARSRAAHADAARRIRAAQQNISAQIAQLDALEDAAPPIENAFTGVLDQALATNDFRLVLDLLRPHAQDQAAGFKITWPENLKEAVNTNKYTVNSFWGGVSTTERSYLEKLHPELCCIVTLEFMRVPVSIPKSAGVEPTQDLRTYMDLFSLLTHTQRVRTILSLPVPTINPETRAPIRSLNSIQYDKQKYDEIQRIIRVYKEFKAASNQTIISGMAGIVPFVFASNDIQGFLNFVKQAQANLEWPAVLAEMLRQQTNDTDGFWGANVTARARRTIQAQHPNLCCPISGKLMRYPVSLIDDQGHKTCCDLLPFLNRWRTNKSDPVTGRPITSLNGLTYEPDLKNRIAQLVAQAPERAPRRSYFPSLPRAFNAISRSTPSVAASRGPGATVGAALRARFNFG